LKLGEVITLKDLQQLQSQKPQSAWFVYDEGVMCWLIAMPSSDLESLDALKSQLIERSLASACSGTSEATTGGIPKVSTVEVRNQGTRANQST